MRDSDPYFETYYYLLNNNNAWVNYKNVTDYSNEVGGVPSVTFSDNRVHVSYNSGEATPPYIGSGVSKSRDKIGSSWQTPQLISDGEYDDDTSREKLQVRDDKLFCLFYDNWEDLGEYGYKIQVKSRDLTGSSWPGSYTTLYSAGDPRILMGAETTANCNLNVVHYYFDNGIVYTYYDGSQWSDDFQVTSDYLNYEMQHLGFSTASNDLFVVWKHTSTSYIKYRQYDAVPLVPPDFAGENYNNHPKLTWTKIEPDIEYFEMGRQIVIGPYDPKNPPPWEHWTTTNTSFIDYSVTIGGWEIGTVNYNARSKDYAGHYSPYTGVVSFGGNVITKQGTVNGADNYPIEFALQQNYPNPFNPTTTIDYSIKSAGLVILKVYDMLGSEVASLVNERKKPGNYNVIFNAANLPSGIYVYRLTTNNFVGSKKLILMK